MSPPPRLGNPAPDAGYALTLIARLRDHAELAVGEHWADVAAGAAAVGMKRASIFGRSPVLDDVKIGLTVFGFLDEHPPTDLVEWRTRAFTEISNSHFYSRRRAIVDGVSEDVLRQDLAAVTAAYRADWTSQVDRSA